MNIVLKSTTLILLLFLMVSVPSCSALIINVPGNSSCLDCGFTFKITTFNIGHFSNGKSNHPDGSYPNLKKYKDKFDTIGSDIVSINENSAYFDNANEISVSELYSSYPFYYCGTNYGYDCNALISKFELTNINETRFSNSSNRYFIDSVLNIKDLCIHIITTHLDWNDINKRNIQISELIDATSKYDYFVICGDMNPASRINGEAGVDPLSQYLKDYQRFVDAGYQLSNCGELGSFNTLTKHEGFAIYPWDNIIVSSNLNIVSVYRENIILSDHYPLTAVINVPEANTH